MLDKLKPTTVIITDECIERLKREGGEDLPCGIRVEYRKSLDVPRQANGQMPLGRGCYIIQS